MEVNTNLIKDIINHYRERLLSCYSESEASSLLYTLIYHFFGISKIDLVKQENMRLSESEMLKIHFAVKALLKHKPIQYITGTVDFLDLKLQVREGVLIPRPETEQLVQIILDDLKVGKPDLSVLDIGTGSACIPIALKHKLSDLKVSAIDSSSQAVELASLNAANHELEIQISQIDVFDDLQMKKLDKFDVIISNPPYVRDSEKKEMQKNVLDYEPESALYVSNDKPLIYYERIVHLAKDMLNKKGSLYFEINEYLGTEIHHLLNNNDFHSIQIKKDFNGRDRFAHALK